MYYFEFKERLTELLKSEVDGDIRITTYCDTPDGDTVFSNGEGKNTGTERPLFDTFDGILLCRESPLAVALIDLRPDTLYEYCQRKGWNGLRTALVQTLVRSGFTKETPHSIRDFEVMLPDGERPLFAALRAYRAKQSVKLSLPPYRVLSNRTLFELCLKKPKNAEELLSVPGIGEQKVKSFGDELLALVQKF